MKIRDGFIYAVTDGCGRAKIGWSNKPFTRLANLQSSCPVPVSLVGLMPGTREDERKLHVRLRAWWLHSEGYRLEGGVATFVATMPKAPPPPPSRKRAQSTNPMALIRLMVFECRQADFARIAGTTQTTVSAWERGLFQPTRTFMKRIRAHALEAGLPWDDRWFFEPPKAKELRHTVG